MTAAELRSSPCTAALVERYIDAHAGSHTLWELEGPAGGTQQVCEFAVV